MSYGLYVFHYTYHVWFLESVRPMIANYIGTPWDYLATTAVALIVTIALGMFSYRFIERPALSLNKHLKYGRVVTTRSVYEKAPVFGLATKRG
jgi:peptidoglycan/LPS O-acetylase OafA/YrhL